jgi:hypothetical protein
MHPYEHATELPPPSPMSRSALKTLRAARRPPAWVAGAVVGGQLCAMGLAAEVPSFMGISIVGPVNVGLALVLVQLGVVTWAVVWYGRYGRETLDPLVERHPGAGQRVAGQWVARSREDHR